MVPYKTRRGKLALNRLKVFEGIPPPYDKQKRVCVPLAMKILCLRSDRKYCQVGRVAHEVGWQYKDVVNTLETKRKIKARLHYAHKQRLAVSYFIATIFLSSLLISYFCRNSAYAPHKKFQRESRNKIQSLRNLDSSHLKMKLKLMHKLIAERL